MIDDLDIDLIGNEEEQEPIEDNEIIEDSKSIIKEPVYKEDILLNSSGSKASTTNRVSFQAFNANYGIFQVYKNSRLASYKLVVSNIPIGSEYQIEASSVIYPSSSTYYVRGNEYLVNNNTSTGFRYWDRGDSALSIDSSCYVILKSGSNNDLSEIQNQLDVMESAIDGIYDNVYDNQMKIDNNNDLLWEVKDYVQGIPDNPVFVRVFGKSDNNNQIGGVGMVSQNIMTTPINQYGLSDSMSLILILMAVAGLIVYLIHKSIFKWGKR